jgi:DNA modification methylase
MIDIQIGDSRKLIHGLTDKSIDCVVTSPPYWGLRDYGHPDQIGLEKTPEKYLKKLLDFFDDVKLKLKDEGNCFVNLGDSYFGSGGAGGDYNKGGIREGQPKYKQGTFKHKYLKSKSLVMIPQRFAWGMIERGWILRNEIIWVKPNHMPESVTDRLTKSHEVIYHFVKQSKYYYDIDVIRESHKDSSMERYQRPLKMGGAKHAGKKGFEIYSGNDWKPEGYSGKFDDANDAESFGSPRARTQRKGAEYKGKWKEDGKYMNEIQRRINETRANGVPHDFALNHPKGKNPGDIWYIPTAPYPESHFATFPLELIRRPILAGCPMGGTVLDPFAGSGTVGEFCRSNERNAILFELNPEYIKLIKERAMINTPELSSWCLTETC